MREVVLGIFAHPDDAEFMCTGTLSLLQKRGWTVHIATLTPGDKGTTEYSREKISFVRKAEATKSAECLQGFYHCLDFEDLFIFYNKKAIEKTTSLIREIHPTIVFTASPDDYMIDHEITSRIVQTACFSAGIVNMEIEEKPFEPIPYLYYCDPMEGKNKFGALIKPGIYVDITSEMQKKEDMLACHSSQRSWLLAHHEIDKYILIMKEFAAKRGKEINKQYAEGFRQHLGHSFQGSNKLKEILSNLVVMPG